MPQQDILSSSGGDGPTVADDLRHGSHLLQAPKGLRRRVASAVRRKDPFVHRARVVFVPLDLIDRARSEKPLGGEARTRKEPCRGLVGVGRLDAVADGLVRLGDAEGRVVGVGAVPSAVEKTAVFDDRARVTAVAEVGLGALEERGGLEIFPIRSGRLVGGGAGGDESGGERE